jgi:outer membrane receptor protein involved in Fe transport
MLCFNQHTAHAQTITGNIGGTVTDLTGAVVPNASITVTNVANGFVFTTTSNSTGNYDVRFLPIGQYKVVISASGFGEKEYGPFSLEIGQDAKINAVLKVRSATVNIEVQAAYIPLLNTEDNVIGETLTSNAIQNVPLNGRNFSSLTVFMPGAVSTQPSGFSGQNGTEREVGANGSASVNGNRLQSNNYTLDGMEINETINNLIGYNPSPDALEELKVISANAPAEYGNVNGGDVVAVTKSGTNQWHGSAFWYLENYKLDANSWSNKHSGVSITHYTQPMFGGTIGGPIIKNKLFFFADYEGFRLPQAGPSTANVATADMRSGNFTELLTNAANGNTQLWNNVNNSATTTPTTYTNNQISVVNPVAQYLFAHPEIYPLPNHTATDGLIENNYVGNRHSDNRNDQGDIKIDWKPTQKDTFSARYLQGEGSDSTTPVLKIAFQGTNSYPDKGIALNEVHTFNPSLVNEFRAGFTRIRWIQGSPFDSTGAFGLKGNSLLGINAVQPFAGFASIEFNSCPGSQSCYTNPTNLGNRAAGQLLTDNTFLYGDDLTWLKGHQQMKMGVEFMRYQQNNYYPGGNGANGYFQYYPTYTENVSTATPGYALADFELNAAGSIGQGGLNAQGVVAGGNGQRQWRSGYFFQDDWKLFPNLTLNLGARYEYDQSIYEVNNKEANIDFATKTIIYAGQDGNSRALYDPTYTNFMPRVGFNWQPTNKLVVRGGFGMTAYLEGTGANLRLTYNPPSWNETNGTSIAPTITSSGTFFTVGNGFTEGSSPSLAGSTYRAWHNVKPSVISEWSLATEYALTNTTNLTVAYIGESGQHLVQAVAANQLTTPCVVNGVVDTATTSAACIAADPAPFYSLVGQNGSVVETASEGFLSYNALQASLRQHLYRGLEYTVNYTWSHSLTNSVGFFGIPDISGPSPYAQNAYNNAAEYGPAGQDVRHAINGTGVYDLPFGHGRQFGGNWNRALDEVAGGWKLAATGVVYSGFPLTISGDDNSATGAHAARPNQYRKLHVTNRSIDHWFGTDASETSCTGHGIDNGSCAYGNTAYGTFGNAHVGTERAPSFQQYDFSAYKDFSIWKEHKLTFRSDFFNAFNISSYDNPDTYYADSTFGQITGVRSVPRKIQFAARYSF